MTTWSSVRYRELALWVLVLLTAATLNVARYREPLMGNDSYQYLSVAENVRYGHNISTSLVHFDIERSSGRIPAPCTSFPAGYPILISLISAVGCSLPMAALIISLLSGLAIVPLLGVAANLLSIPPALTRICLLLWVINSYVITFSGAVITESLFTLLSFSAIVLVLRYESFTVQNNRGWLLLLAFLCAGMAYWVRYAGLFLFAALVVYGLVQAYKRSRVAWLASMVAGAGVIGIGALRNILLTGTWQGVYAKNPHHSPMLIARAFGTSIYHLFFGDVPLHFGLIHGVAEVTAWLGALGLFVALAAALLAKGSRAEISCRLVKPLLVLILYAVIYSGGMFYLGVVTSISFSSRMFYPLLPVLLLLIARSWSSLSASIAVAKLWPRMACAAFLVSYAVLNLQSVSIPYVSPHRVVGRWLQMPMETGQPLAAWITHNITDRSVIVSEDGQETGYVLHRNTISLAPPHFSLTLWSEPQLYEVMRSFNAEYLLVYTAPESNGIQQHDGSSFLEQLANGSAPSWLSLAAENPRVKVFRRRLL